MSFVTIKTCDTVQEAYLTKGHLENEGIKCFVQNEHVGTIVPHYSGVLSGINVVVDAKEFKRANVILGNTEEKTITCPNCGSGKYKFGFRKRRVSVVFVFIISLISVIPFGNIKINKICSACGTWY